MSKKIRCLTFLVTLCFILTLTNSDCSEFEINIDCVPNYSNFYKSEKFDLLLNLKTAPEPVYVDVYFVVMNSQREIYYGMDWSKTPHPAFSNYKLPPDLVVKNADFMSIMVPDTNPPLSRSGNHIFAMGFAKPGTLEFISDISTLKLNFINTLRPETGEERTYDGIEFIYIPPGRFDMGSENGYIDEVPIHRVHITKGFWLSKYEIKQEQWVSVMDFNPSYYTGEENLPVELVTWYDVQDFIETLGDEKYRLPTEAEWEYSCRAGTTTEFFFGEDDTNIEDYCWWWENGEGKSHPVGQKLPNNWGLYDMMGNIWEWCSDWYGRLYYAESPLNDPTGPENGQFKITRGASILGDSPTFDLRSAVRCQDDPTHAFPNLGIRLLREE